MLIPPLTNRASQRDIGADLVRFRLMRSADDLDVVREFGPQSAENGPEDLELAARGFECPIWLLPGFDRLSVCARAVGVDASLLVEILHYDVKESPYPLVVASAKLAVGALDDHRWWSTIATIDRPDIQGLAYLRLRPLTGKILLSRIPGHGRTLAFNEYSVPRNSRSIAATLIWGNNDFHWMQTIPLSWTRIASARGAIELNGTFVGGPLKLVGISLPLHRMGDVSIRLTSDRLGALPATFLARPTRHGGVEGNVLLPFDECALLPRSKYAVSLQMKADQLGLDEHAVEAGVGTASLFGPASSVGFSRGAVARLTRSDERLRAIVLESGDKTESPSNWRTILGADIDLLHGSLDSLGSIIGSGDFEIVVITDTGWPPGSRPSVDHFLDWCHRAGIVTVWVGDVERHRDVARRAHIQIDTSAIFSPRPKAASVLLRGIGDRPSVGAIRKALRSLVQPRVAIVSVLYGKSRVIESFLTAIGRQSYPGPIDIVLVDDCSPDDDVDRVNSFLASNRVPGNVTVSIIRNDTNLGNCVSRNAGLAARDADIYVIIDADCLINRDFIAAHVFAHAYPDADVVVGPLNIEIPERNPLATLLAYEEDPDRIKREETPQDMIFREAPTNCITRNFSVKAAFVPKDGLFDPQFAYRASAPGGFGWEDVDAGWSLAAQGARLAYTEDAFSLHVSHPSAIEPDVKSAGLRANFRKLWLKHPDLPVIARRWFLETGVNIAAAAPEEQKREAADFLADCENVAGRRALPRSKRRLKILTHAWHIPHQYELYKSGHDFTLILGLGPEGMQRWKSDQRPTPKNIRYVDYRDVNLRDYDMALLHFDENVLAPENCNGVIPHNWGAAARWLMDCDTLPKVGVCHGTPQFQGQYRAVPGPMKQFEILDLERQRLVDWAAKCHVVVNSCQALLEWGFRQASVIWHGLDPQEYKPATYRRDVLATLRPIGERPHYRGAFELEQIMTLLPNVEFAAPVSQDAGLRPLGTYQYGRSRFQGFIDAVREFTVYLNTTRRSPMPRSRTEAMMCGVVPVSLANHDVELFTVQGINGFVGHTPEELADYVEFLCSNRTAAAKIGKRARLDAASLFNHDRYLADWDRLLTEVTG